MADASIPASTAEDLLLLDDAKPLRDSMLWTLQSAFYKTHGAAAWADSIVPSFITTNAYVASLYARVVIGFLRDWFTEDPKSGPLDIIEIGAGSGKFGFLIVRALLEMRAQWPNSQGTPPFTYILTDVSAANVEFWRTHECIAPLIAAGIVDTAVFDAETQRTLTTTAGRTLKSGGTRAPVIAIANYVLDSLRQVSSKCTAWRFSRIAFGWSARLPHRIPRRLAVALAASSTRYRAYSPQDAFRIVNGRLEEGLVALYSTAAEEPAPHSPDVIARMRCVWSWRPCSPEIYKNPHLQVSFCAPAADAMSP